ncbi:MAG: HD domain-containing protein [Clostridiales bacterium]|nr:HD domain-containing protein [Clostridiales bacterium]
MNTTFINMYDLLLCISNALDLSTPILVTHHQRVAYLSFTIAKELQLSLEDQKDIYSAAMIHDIGALTVDEKISIARSNHDNLNRHAFIGADITGTFGPLNKVAKIIKYHHLPWNHGKGRFYKGDEVPYTSHIINFADTVCNLIKPDIHILSQIETILDVLDTRSGDIFDPKLVEFFRTLSKKEYIWLDIMSKSPVDNLINIDKLLSYQLDLDDIIDLTHIFSYLIDFRSEFTAVHSAGVANVAKRLAKLNNFSETECKMMLIAGYLHDLGKLAIASDILDKPGKLTDDEFDIIRSHTYYTYQLLSAIPNFQTISSWAAFHHEKLDGTGYPFHLDRRSLSVGSRIMAVADIFTAITENRPYRKGMSKDETIRVLNSLVENQSIDGNIVRITIENYEDLWSIRETAQSLAEQRYITYKNY